MRWLVTGGVGFIGFHVSRALAARGDTVTIVDDFSDTPYPAAMKRRNQADLLAAYPATRVVRACVTDASALGDVFAEQDGVVHLAGLAGVRPSLRAPAHYARVNVEGTATVLDLAVAAGIENVLVASSSSVYGNATPLPAREDAPAIVPESPYAATKRASELVAATVARRAPRLSCTVLRLFTVYGPRQRPEMAITTFTRALLAGDPVIVFGDGSMRRDFTHVDDIVRGITAAADAAGPGYRVYNLGSAAPVTLSALVEALGRAVGVSPVVHRSPIPDGDVDATFADITRARTDLGWSPRIGLQDGLASFVAWCIDNPSPTSRLQP